jgi:hypothetical protein
MLLAAKLYEERKLALGYRAELAGLSKRAFIEPPGRYGVSLFPRTADELQPDIDNASKFFDKTIIADKSLSPSLTSYSKTRTPGKPACRMSLYFVFILPWGLIPRPLGRLKSATPTKIGKPLPPTACLVCRRRPNQPELARVNNSTFTKDTPPFRAGRFIF